MFPWYQLHDLQHCGSRYKVVNTFDDPAPGMFLHLASESLLQSYLKRRTQNRNESLHSKFWRVCKKHKHCNSARVVFGAGATVQKHHFGHLGGSLLARMGLLTEEVPDDKSHCAITSQAFDEEELRCRQWAVDSYAPGSFSSSQLILQIYIHLFHTISQKDVK